MTLFRPVLGEFATLIPFVAGLRRNFSVTFFWLKRYGDIADQFEP